MHRRDFLVTSAQAAVVGSAALSAGPSSAAEAASSSINTSSILGRFTAEDHRRRLQNVGIAQRGIRSCMRKHLITDYLPAQCCYNLGEYPCRKPWDLGRVRRAGTRPAQGPRHPVDPGVRRLERFAAAVRRRQVHGARIRPGSAASSTWPTAAA